MTSTDSLETLFGNVIYAYSRADAMADGALVDVSETAREEGFRIPVAMTVAAWNDCMQWCEADSKRQNAAGRGRQTLGRDVDGRDCRA